MSKKTTFTTIGLAFLAVVLACGIVRYLFSDRPMVYGELKCQNNLDEIQELKIMWATENHKTAHDVVTWDDIRPYFPNWFGTNGPTCPAGGTYTLGRLDEVPRCSIPGHKLIPGNATIIDDKGQRKIN